MHDRVPQSHNNFAAIYCRISRDKTGLSAGVDRQEQDCRALADRLGLTVKHVFVDNDISAYSGKPRPDYAKLLELMKDGEIGTVLAFHQDRLQRSPVELEQYVDISEVGHVTTHTVLAGHIDLSTPSGRFNARIIGAAARYEVEHMIERQRAAKLQAAKDGEYLGGQRPFGFEPRRLGLREEEASLIRDMASAFTTGASYWSIAIDLNRRGIRTQHGKEWSALKIRNVLIRPINAGIVRHQGVDYMAKSPAVLTMDEWHQLERAIARSKRKSTHPGRTRKHLLNGFVFCGECGEKLFHKSKQQRDGSYKTKLACGKLDHQTGLPLGCGGVSRMADPVIDLVTDAVIDRLSKAAPPKSNQSSDQVTALLTREQTLHGQIDELTTDYYVNRMLSRDEFEHTKATLDAELLEVEKAIAGGQSHGLLGTATTTEELRHTWDDATLHWKREVLAEIVDRIVIHRMPRTKGYRYPMYKGWRFDPRLVKVEWRGPRPN